MVRLTLDRSNRERPPQRALCRQWLGFQTERTCSQKAEPTNSRSGCTRYYKLVSMVLWVSLLSPPQTLLFSLLFFKHLNFLIRTPPVPFRLASRAPLPIVSDTLVMEVSALMAGEDGLSQPQGNRGFRPKTGRTESRRRFQRWHQRADELRLKETVHNSGFKQAREASWRQVGLRGGLVNCFRCWQSCSQIHQGCSSNI